MQSVNILRVVIGTLFGIVLVLPPGGLRAAQTASVAHPFPYPPALRPQVEFWQRVFTTSRQTVILHDNVHMIVYKELDFQPLYEAHADRQRTLARLRKQRVEREIRHIRTTLRKLHRANRTTRLTAEERRIKRLFSDIPGSRKFLRAAAEGRVRSQTGIGEKFRQGIQISGRYLDEMEAIFRQAGLPVELTRLPLVESTFNINAYSKAGAAGVWQFIRSTGRLFMRVDGLIDERRDPLLSAQAAAKLLKANYDRLGTWPLAITAYNHGQAGMVRAVRKLGTTDIARIIRSYKSRRFGFASRNFYPEFLAALEVEKNATAYFGEIKRDAPFRYDEVALDGYLSLGVAARCANISTERLIEFNPALGRSIRRGRRFIPSGYRLRLPDGTADYFRRQYAALDINSHTVQPGQTLDIIAQRYRTSVKALQELNHIPNVNFIRVGQRLRLPHTKAPTVVAQAPAAPAPSQPTPPEAAPELPTTVVQAPVAPAPSHTPQPESSRSDYAHTVQHGQTLGTIAQRYQTTVATLKKLNGIERVNFIRPGQQLRLPGSYATHTVQRGQTLDTIAKRYGTTAGVLKRLNGVKNPRLLRIGQTLYIPLSY
ncbi:MAG: LysM peptidoglycan-binding domain-containing protein [Desulfurellaceae bacterium]|nr:LysM peptidoglycan-binding domain-containing protein [Desulfurellaceae bacterium]